MENTIDYVAIGKRIKKLRLAKGMTQDELRDGIDISKTHMSHIETGSTMLSLPALVLLANRLDTTTDNLLMDNLTTTVPAFRKDIEDIISDCTPYELRAMIEGMVLIKNTIRNIPKDSGDN